MNFITFGIRNAFRNLVRTAGIVLILGLSIGLSLVMLIAHQAVSNKISSVKSSIGNTITIAPAGFSAFSQANNSLTTSELSSVKSLPHVSSVVESLTDRLTTAGQTSPFSGFGGSSNSTTNTTSLTSPVTLNTSGGGFGGRARLFISGGGQLPTNFSLPITITGTTDPTQLNGSSLTITSGTAINGSSSSDDAMISSAMASKNNLHVGSTFTAYTTTLTVAAIFTDSTQAGNGTVIVSLPTEQALSGQSGDVTGAVATVDSIDNLTSVTTAIKNSLGSAADVTSAEAQADQAVAPLNSVKSISLYSLVGAVIAGSVIILMTMIMIVRERRREIGILKAIGASNLRVIGQFMSEALTLTIAGAVIGLIIGVAGGGPVTQALVSNTSTTTTTSATTTGGPGRFGGGGGGGGFVRRNFSLSTIGNNLKDIHADIGLSILAYGFGAAVIIAFVGSASAGWMIARVRPSEVMRTE
jgi:putative ABC transport system permease protein